VNISPRGQISALGARGEVKNGLQLTSKVYLPVHTCSVKPKGQFNEGFRLKVYKNTECIVYLISHVKLDLPKH
jgi:hypothetical protein